MAEREYRRLTGSKNRSLFSVAFSARTSLWLGKDHILQIDTSGYSEIYKRFYFRDVQALVFCRTDRWLYQGVGLLGAACFFALIAVTGGGPVVAGIFGTVAGVFGFFLLFHLLLGPSCKCYLHTAVQIEPLISMSRSRRALKVLQTLRPLILAAQETARPGPGPTPEAPPVISTPPPPTSSLPPEASDEPTNQPA